MRLRVRQVVATGLSQLASPSRLRKTMTTTNSIGRSPLLRHPFLRSLDANIGAIGVWIGFTGATVALFKWLITAQIHPLEMILSSEIATVNNNIETLVKKMNTSFKALEVQMGTMNEKLDQNMKHLFRMEDRYAKFGERLARLEEKIKNSSSK